MLYGLVGKWKNEHGSVIKVTSHTADGAFRGTFSSSTGAIGRYKIVGYSPLIQSSNQPTAYITSWRPMHSTTKNPSWHWIGMTCGVVFLDKPQTKPLQQIVYGGIVSSSFRQLEKLSLGVYTEPLLDFILEEDALSPATSAVDTPKKSVTAHGGAGALNNISTTDKYQQISYIYDQYGYVLGSILMNNGMRVSVHGFTDIDPQSIGNLQALAVSGTYKDEKNQTYAFTLGGIIHTSNKIVQFKSFESHAIAYDDKHATVNFSQEIFSIAHDNDKD